MARGYVIRSFLTAALLLSGCARIGDEIVDPDAQTQMPSSYRALEPGERFLSRPRGAEEDLLWRVLEDPDGVAKIARERVAGCARPTFKKIPMEGTTYTSEVDLGRAVGLDLGEQDLVVLHGKYEHSLKMIVEYETAYKLEVDLNPACGQPGDLLIRGVLVGKGKRSFRYVHAGSAEVGSKKIQLEGLSADAHKKLNGEISWGREGPRAFAFEVAKIEVNVPLDLRVRLSQTTIPDHGHFEVLVETGAPAYLIGLSRDESGAMGVVFPVQALRHGVRVEPGVERSLENPIVVALPEHAKAAGKSIESLVVYAFRHEADYRRFVPPMGQGVPAAKIQQWYEQTLVPGLQELPTAAYAVSQELYYTITAAP